jgi:thiol-disulfide isomerase/thioredoxin
MKQLLPVLALGLVLSSSLTLAATAPGSASTPAHTGRQAPEIAGIENWINSPPLSLAGLRGKVVLVNFWTFGCSNCQATLPVVARWYDTYRSRGFVVIGVHTPEFPHEHGRAETEAAVQRFGLHYPVAQDNASATWKAYGNRYWPAFYFVDARGEVRYERFGEGGYEESEKVIQTLLAEAQGEQER